MAEPMSVKDRGRESVSLSCIGVPIWFYYLRLRYNIKSPTIGGFLQPSRVTHGACHADWRRTSQPTSRQKMAEVPEEYGELIFFEFS